MRKCIVLISHSKQSLPKAKCSVDPGGRCQGPAIDKPLNPHCGVIYGLDLGLKSREAAFNYVFKVFQWFDECWFLLWSTVVTELSLNALMLFELFDSYERVCIDGTCIDGRTRCKEQVRHRYIFCIFNIMCRSGSCYRSS